MQQSSLTQFNYLRLSGSLKRYWFTLCYVTLINWHWQRDLSIKQLIRWYWLQDQVCVYILLSFDSATALNREIKTN
jgi:hypothetical protein